jgi:hypothetical protein
MSDEVVGCNSDGMDDFDFTGDVSGFVRVHISGANSGTHLPSVEAAS